MLERLFGNSRLRVYIVSLALCGLLLNASAWAADSNPADQSELASVDAQLAKSPHDVDLQVKRAEALGRLGRYEEEVQQANALLKQNPSFRNGYLLQEHAFLRQKKYQQALVALNTAFLHGAPDGDELVAKASLLILTKNIHDALLCCNKALALEPNNAKAYSCRADCYYQLYGASKKCLDDLEKSAAIDPSREKVQQLIKVIKGQVSSPQKFNQ